MNTNVSRAGSLIRWGGAFVIAGLLTHATLSVAAPDPACLEKASKTRADELKIAYNDYAREMIRMSDKLAKDEQESLKIVGVSGQNELIRAQTSHTNDMMEANRILLYKLQQAWGNYNSKISTCGYNVGSVSQPFHGTYQYGGGYQYGNQYPWYGQYGNQYPWYGHYGHYSFHGQGYCPQVVMTTLPAGCGYECKHDDRGCQTCEVSCRNVDTAHRPNCICPAIYSPVCGRDGVTYTNSCYALCADVGLAYGGTCR